MPKINLDEITSGYNLQKVNDNFQKIANEFNERVLYRDNIIDEDNSMRSHLDMNGFDVMNVGTFAVGNIEVQGVSFAEQIQIAQQAAIDSEVSASASAGFSNNAQVAANQVASDKVTIEGYKTQAETARDVAVAAAEEATESVQELRDDLASSDGSDLIGFKQDDVAAISRTVENKLRETISIQDFGAVGDGVANDSIAINAALKYADSIGGAIVVNSVPGTYKIVSELFMGRNTTLLSVPGVVYKRYRNGSLFSNRLNNTSATSGYSGNGNICIDGGVWDGNSVEFYNAFNCFAIGYADNVIVRNLTVLDVIRAHAIDLSSCRNVLIDNCKFLGFAHERSTSSDTLGEDRTYAEAIQIDQNTPGSFSWGALDGSPCQNVVVRNCRFGPNPLQTDPRFGSWGVGVGGHGSVNDRYMQGIKITGCFFEGCGYAGIRPFKWVNTVISENEFQNCIRAVHFTQVSFNTLSANNADGSPSGHGQAGRDCVITGNVFDGYVDIAVFFQHPIFDTGEAPFKFRNLVVHSNTIRNGPDRSALIIRWVDGLSICGNSFTNLYRAINLEYTSNVSITGNTARDVVREMIYLSESISPAQNGQGYSSDVSISANNGVNLGYSGINLGGAIQRFSITDNLLTGVSTAAATRFGISLSGGVTDGLISGNHVVDGGGPIKPVYGIDITNTCSNIRVENNKLFGTTGPVRNAGIGNSSTNQFIGTGTATYDPVALPNAASAVTTVSVAGALVGDVATATFSLDLQGVSLTAWVSAPNTVSVQFLNMTGAPVDLASGTLRVSVSRN